MKEKGEKALFLKNNFDILTLVPNGSLLTPVILRKSRAS